MPGDILPGLPDILNPDQDGYHDRHHPRLRKYAHRDASMSNCASRPARDRCHTK